MNKYKKLSINTLIMFIGTTGSKLISFIMLPFYTKWLSVSDYGITDSINTYVSLLIGVISLCLCDAIFIFPSKQIKEVQKKYFSTGFIFGFSLFCFAFIILLILHFFIHSENVFFNYIWFIYLMTFTLFLENYVQQFLRGQNKLILFSTTGIIYTVLLTFFSVIMIPKYGVIGYALGMLFANIIATIAIFFISKTYQYFSVCSFDKNKLREMLKYAFPLVPNSVMWWVISAINRPILENYVGTEGIGLYSIANKFPSLIAVVFTIFSNSLMVSIIEEYGKDNYRSFFNKIYKMIFYFQILGITILIVVSPYIIKMVTKNQDYYQAWIYMPILAISVLFSNCSSFLGCNFSVSKETKYFFYSSIIGAGTALTMNLILIPTFGIWGAVLSSVFANLFMLFSREIFSRKIVIINNKLSYYILITLVLLLFFTVKKAKIYLEIIICFFIVGLLIVGFVNTIKEIKYEEKN